MENSLYGSLLSLLRAQGRKDKLLPYSASGIHQGRCSFLDPAVLGKDIIALLGASCCPPLVPYPRFKAQLDPPALVLPKQKATQTPLLAACKGYVLFRTCSHVLGRWQILNLLLVLLAPDCLQWGDGVQHPGRGGWRSQNLRSWRNTISDGSLKDEASFSSQTTTLCMSLMLHWP